MIDGFPFALATGEAGAKLMLVVAVVGAPFIVVVAIEGLPQLPLFALLYPAYFTSVTLPTYGPVRLIVTASYVHIPILRFGILASTLMFRVPPS
jgi:hypothetical protein